ncbi:helix-turn-helix domain-containing protein [Phytohabitans suffuscus]|uniref:helix-turn-helix domain-containing protein n=1 Tax=Phytohabitans suffuscus TaxID=624315 RepID=UPI001563ADDA|nr:helix-turn-helix transcriptional regulator [Phytohabitans suffuscus]
MRKLRIAAALSVETVVSEAEWSTSKLVRIENGQVGISKADLSELLRIYGTTDQNYIDELQELARVSRQRMWWSEFQRFLPATYQEFIGAEFDASRIRYIQPLIVPGILQIASYAETINVATTPGTADPEVTQKRVEARMRRQTELFQRRGSVEIIAVLDEAVLRRPVGGAETMRQQLDHLARIAEEEAITLVVLPFSVGPHLGMLGPFTLLEYEDPQDADIVYLENANAGLILRDQAAVVDAYREATHRMVEVGLRNRAAVDFIRQARKRFA